MKLFEHPDFEQAVLRAAEYFRSRGLRPAIIEKDYYVTEALRAIAVNASGNIIFKGGTSLLKGWNLIERFSEDIDIFLDPLAFQPPLGKNAIDRELKRLRDMVGEHLALDFGSRDGLTADCFDGDLLTVLRSPMLHRACEHAAVPQEVLFRLGKTDWIPREIRPVRLLPVPHRER